MLFTSYEFLFLFLPIALLGFAVLRGRGWGNLVIYWLVLCSMVFYGWWSLRALAGLLASVTANFLLARAIQKCPAGSRARYFLLAAGVAANVGLLALFKYSGFFFENVNAIFGDHFPIINLVLPLGISFFSFQQIIYLVDTYRGKVQPHKFADYFAFITFFPHLIAGPLIHQGDVLPQFAARRFNEVSPRGFCVAITVFVIGLSKKVLIADGIAPYANAVFNAAAAGTSPTFVEAWCGALAYTLQLYFDFSGYSDMAIGLAAMFGIILPLNFFSPYKAGSIIDFWRRWHITLSRFLRDYLYVPLGGNRRGSLRRYINIMLVMLVGGLWHGAGWTFVAWGFLHGLYLCVNHAWRFVRPQLPFGGMQSNPATRGVSWMLTFGAILVGWVIFRSDNWTAVSGVLSGMAGLNGMALPETYLAALGSLGRFLLQLGVKFEPPDRLNLFFGAKEVLVLFGLLLAVRTLPNGVFWVTKRQPSFAEQSIAKRAPAYSIWRFPNWAPSPAWAVVLGCSMVAALLLASRPTEFLYFQF